MAVAVGSSSCPHGFSHRSAYTNGARFCPGCRAPLDHAEPAPRARLGDPKRPAYAWARSEPAVVGDGEGGHDVDTTQDGVRRWFAWRSFVVGVVDTAAGPVAVAVSFPRAAPASPASVGAVPAGADRAAAPTVPAAVPTPGVTARAAPSPADVPTVRTLPLLPGRPRGPGRPLSKFQAEPVIVQGLALIALPTQVLAIDLFADDLKAVPVIRLSGTDRFANCLHLRGDELFAVVRAAGVPQVVTLQPARDAATGVIRLNGEWAWKVAPSEVVPGTFADDPAHPAAGGGSPGEFRRAIFAGDAVFLPGNDSCLVATLTPYDRPDRGAGDGAAGGARWVWRRQGRHDGQRAFADARYAWALGNPGEAGGGGGATAGHDGGDDYGDYDYDYDDPSAARHGHAGRGSAGASPGILAKGLDAGEEPVWCLLRPERDGQVVLRQYPESEVIVADGRIYGIRRDGYQTDIQEFDDVGGPRANRVTVSGASVDRLLPAGDDLVTVVRDGHALKVWAYNRVGSLRGADDGGQVLLGEGESLAPPLLLDDRIVCAWTDSRQLYVAAARLAPR